MHQPSLRRGSLAKQISRFTHIISTFGALSTSQADIASFHLRLIVRYRAHCNLFWTTFNSIDDFLLELKFLNEFASLLKPAFNVIRSKRVLFTGQAYYNSWYLSRALRKNGWKSNLLDWDENISSRIYYHGHDFRFNPPPLEITLFEILSRRNVLSFYISALYGYNIYHFSNANGICFGFRLSSVVESVLRDGDEIRLIRRLGNIIVYSNNGCQDGVSQTSFSKWGPESPCSICRWQDVPSVCSDERNLSFGKFRNEVANYQCIIGGNRADYNLANNIHEVPEFYCLSPKVWHPSLAVPKVHRLPRYKDSPTPLHLYHAVGNLTERTRENGVNIKSTHVYLPLIKKLQAQGHLIDLVSPSGIPNKQIRFLQVQCDIFLDMLTFGWFGANAREAMMLAKPVICFIRPEWLDNVRREIPEYADELPIVSATPHTIEDVLRRLILDSSSALKSDKKSSICFKMAFR